MRMGREDIRDDHAAALIQKITKHGGAFKSVAVVEGLQRQTTVSISDCSSPAGGLQEKDGERYSNLERMKSSNNVLTRTYVTDSSDSGGEDIIRRKFSIAPGEPVGVRQYKGMVPQLNGRARGTQICDKRQRVCLGTFNGDIMISKHTYEEEPSNSKNNDASRCSETNQKEEEESCKGAERNYNLGGEGNDKKASPRRREHMFEKPLTPSDVGKLNRLVIPKQHAEKYLPLDTDANEKGLLLDFEDSTGKEWQFRYSYWNSSQSYVLTKGWSRFVKEMKLKEGDIVAFHRATHKDPILQRLFISCKRKLCSAAQPTGKQGPAVKRPLQFSSPFQFPLNNIGGSHAQQLVTSRAALISPQWKPLFWPTNNVIGSHGAPETRILQTNAKPMDLLSSLHLTATTDEKQRKRKGIHDLGFPFSIQRLSNTTEYGRYAVDTMNWLKAPSLRAMLKAPGISADDLSAATSFDHSTSTYTSTSVPTSKKVVRLFGVNLECGKL